METKLLDDLLCSPFIQRTDGRGVCLGSEGAAPVNANSAPFDVDPICIGFLD